MSPHPHAAALNARAIELEQSGRPEAAAALYREAALADPSWGAPWFNIGLLHKRARRWAECLEANREASRRDAPDQATWWNLAIAATALGEWSHAREAWRAAGIEIPDGDGPPDLDFGLVPIRLGGDPPEVVWCRRLDPARGRIENVPLPDGGRRWREIVLHDGVPNGYRMLRGREVPVFDELQPLEPSPFETFTARVLAPSRAAVDALAERAFDEGLAFEDWTAAVRTLCRDCSEGRPCSDHAPASGDWIEERHVGVAARGAASARALLDAWAGAHGARVLDGPARAERP